MTEIQFGSGPSSSATHRLTQSSSTLNRRYVGRPSNLAIDEAARRSNDDFTSTAPSRLVNLRVHESDLKQAQPIPRPEPEACQAIIPRTVEFGEAADTAPSPESIVDYSQLVPAEAAPVEEVSYVPAVRTASDPYNGSPYPDSAQTNDCTDYNSNNSYTEDNFTSDSTALVAVDPNNEADTQTLAMSIAADYAAANLGASLSAPNAIPNDLSSAVASSSVDTIARAASDAIAAIRTASGPEEIAEQVTSLQAFANNIRANSAAPEMLELSDTIDKFVSVAMKSSRVQEEVEKKAAIARAEQEAKTQAQSSIKVATKRSTVSVPKPTVKPIKATAKRTSAATLGARKVARPARSAAPKSPKTSLMRRSAKKTVAPKIGADEEQALRKALRSVAAIDEEPTTAKSTKVRRQKTHKGSGKRFALAFFCAILCVGAIVYFVGSNIPDISVKVAAMQTGIEASYPSYVPRDFSLDGVNSEVGKITLTFKGPEKRSFVLSEEKSSWDSTTLLRNYVEPTWNESYITTHEQGITIYISGANAAWVNGGVLYKIESSNNGLTKKQLRNIVTSL